METREQVAQFPGSLNSTTGTDQMIECSFSVDYSVDSFRYDKTIEVLMATFCSVSVLWAALKAYRLAWCKWNRCVIRLNL